MFQPHPKCPSSYLGLNYAVKDPKLFYKRKDCRAEKLAYWEFSFVVQWSPNLPLKSLSFTSIPFMDPCKGISFYGPCKGISFYLYIHEGLNPIVDHLGFLDEVDMVLKDGI